jgi:NADPH:quinone reductase-like Zn-dependent oxidoreductase
MTAPRESLARRSPALTGALAGDDCRRILMSLKRVLKWTAAAIPLTLLVTGIVAYWRSDNACGDRPAAPPTHPMKAVVYCDYGSPDVLRVEKIEKPVPTDDQVLIKVHAAALNPLDWHFMRGTPYLARFTMGLRRPKSTRLGVDFAGVVESVGRNVTQLEPGDEVFGGRTGALAEYVVARADRAVVLKPANVTFEQAAAVPVAAITALQGLRDQGKIRPGQQVLINGASGGVGTFAVQLAKSFGAEVTGVCSTRNVELVRSIGADHVVDYTKEDFTTGAQRYDLIIDNVGNHSLRSLGRLLKPNGRYVMIGGASGRWLDPLPRVLGALAMSRIGSHEMRFFVSELNVKDLTMLRDLMQAGTMTPVVDRRYTLSEIRAALRYQETGRARGKVVITVD